MKIDALDSHKCSTKHFREKRRKMITILGKWERLAECCDDRTRCEECSMVECCSNIAKEENKSRKPLLTSKKHKKIVDYCANHECKNCGIDKRRCEEADLTCKSNVNRLYERVKTAEITTESEDYILKREKIGELFRRLAKKAGELSKAVTMREAIMRFNPNSEEIAEAEGILRWAMAEVIVVCNLLENDTDAREDLEYTQKVIKEMWARRLQSEEELESGEIR